LVDTDIVHLLLRNACYIEAVSFIYDFKLVEHFPPVPILKKYSKHIEGTANGLLKKEIKSQKAQVRASFILSFFFLVILLGV
jgi:predicted nucleic acid-binding protein